MYSTPTPTESLMARQPPQGGPGGVTPELIQLLAQMKVKQATDAAARDMAMQSGQQPPTVAQGLGQELQGNATNEIMKKLAPQGLRALAPQVGAAQGQNVQAQQAQQGGQQMPTQPTQGIAGAQSNLPQAYAGGGIVAFEEGGQAPRYGGAYGGKNLLPDTTGYEGMGIGEFLKSVGASAADTGKEAYAKIENFLMEGPGSEGRRRRAFDEEQGAARTDTSFNPEETVGGPAGLAAAPPDVAKAPPDVAKGPPAGGLPAAARSVGNSTRVSVRGPGNAGEMATGRPVMSPEDVLFKNTIQKGVLEGASRDPAAAKAGAAAEYEARFGADQKAALGNQQQGLAKIQALQDAAVANRPKPHFGFLNPDAVAAIGRNVHAQPGQWGQGVYAATEAARTGRETADMAHQVQVNGLQAAMDKAKQENNAGAWNAAKAAMDSATREKEAYTRDGVSMANTNEQAEARKQGAWDAAEARKQAAQFSYQARVDAKAAGATENAIKLAEAAAARDPEMLSLRDLLKKMEAPDWKVLDQSGRTPEGVFRRMAAITEEKYTRFGIGMPTDPNKKEAPASTLSPADAALVAKYRKG